MVYVLEDNREVSIDSRTFMIGAFQKTIIGTVILGTDFRASSAGFNWRETK